MATMDLWIEGDWGQEPPMVWSQELALDFDRLQDDPEYLERIHDHIKRGLHYLAKEVEEFGRYENARMGDRSI